MLSLKIAGRPVDLPDDFSFTMNLKSPIFGEVGSYSYPFRIPNTPRNAILMGFRHRVENTTDVYKEDEGVFMWNGLNLFQGTVKLKTLNSKSFEGSIFEGEGDFYYSRKYLSLQDVDFGEMVFAGETLKMDYINDCKNRVYPERIVTFPMILNKSYFEKLPPEPVLEYFNYYNGSLIYYFTPSAEPYDRSVIVPMLYLRYILDKIFDHLGFVFDDSFFTSDSDYNSLALFNSVDCNTGETGYFEYDKLRLLFNYHLPRMTINDFFLGLETFFNIRFFVNNTTKVVKLKSVDTIVKETDYIEFSQQVISKSTEPEELITGFHLKMEMETDDEFYVASNEAQQTLLTNIKSSVQSVSDLMPWPASDVFDTRFVFDENNYYILNSSKVWVAVTEMYWTWNLFSEWIYKNNDQSIETKFSTLKDDGVTPYNSLIGNAMTEWKKVTPKLFFTHYQDNGYGDQKQVGRCFTPTNNLFYGGQYGLMNKQYKAYLDFRMSTKLVKINKQMSYLELKEFDFSRKYMINGVKYLVKSIQVTLKKDRIMPALLECYPCP